MALLILMALLLTGNLRQPERALHDPDIWWHLANARILFATHHFIHVEPYSFTVAGDRWTDTEWLSEVPFWLGYRAIGLAGIYLVTVIALCANVLFVYWRCDWKTRHAGVAFWAALLGIPLMVVNSGPRTILFAYLAMSAEMATLEAAERGKTRWLWLLPPLFCVWINLHGSWVIGIGLLALYILCGLFPFKKGVFDQKAYSGGDRRRLILVFAASLAALLANPYGWRLLSNPFDIMLHQKLNIANVQEWRPLNLSWFSGEVAVVAIGLMVVANCVSGRKWKVYELAFIFFAWYAAFDHARFTFLACVVTMPWLAGDLARSFFAKPNEKTIPVLNALFVAVVAGIVVHFFPAEAALENGLAARFPLQSIASIQPAWRTYNQEWLGGLMDFYSKSPFLDTRYDTFEHHGILKDFLDIAFLQDLRQLLNEHRIDHVLVPADWPLAQLLEQTPDWRVARREGAGKNAYVLLAKVSGAVENPAPCAAVPAARRHEGESTRPGRETRPIRP